MKGAYSMDMDDEVCLCFHVTKRKLTNYLRIEKVRRASQLSNCGGAGSGCGWCVPYLNRLFGQAMDGRVADLPDAEEYADGRNSHIQDGKGVPPP